MSQYFDPYKKLGYKAWPVVFSFAVNLIFFMFMLKIRTDQLLMIETIFSNMQFASTQNFPNLL